MSLLNRSHRHVGLVPARGLFSFPGLKVLGVTLACLMVSSAALAANITVASPVNGTSVTSPVWIRAHNVGCNGLAPTAFGYSVDNAAGLSTGVTPFDVDVTNSGIPAGTHTVHFKAWTSAGVCPVVSTTFVVGGTASSGTSSSGTSSSSSGASTTGAPANAIPSADLDGAANWNAIHDGGTPGSSRGSTVYPASTPLYDDAREFYMTYTAKGGERWSLAFGKDPNATHFILDTYVFLTDPSQVQNLELDMNQVMPNGQTVILGTQCSSISGTWESAYTVGRLDHWLGSNVKCNPRTWAPNQWHHIQIAMHRDANGVVTHDWVNLDGSHQVFSGATRGAAQSLGWASGVLLVNYQIEGNNAGSGSVTSYIHKMTVIRW
jgi:hypothetical protein